MKGDFSRSTFNPGKHYTSVRMQQGRVQTDADWNEQANIPAHLGETSTRVETGWQVRVAPIGGAGPDYITSYAEPGEVAETPLCAFANPEWDALNLNPARTLAARVQPAPPSTNACEILPRAGYQRL